MVIPACRVHYGSDAGVPSSTDRDIARGDPLRIDAELAGMAAAPPDRRLGIGDAIGNLGPVTTVHAVLGRVRHHSSTGEISAMRSELPG